MESLIFAMLDRPDEHVAAVNAQGRFVLFDKHWPDSADPQNSAQEIVIASAPATALEVRGTNLSLRELLQRLVKCGRHSASRLSEIPRESLIRGIAWAIVGVVVTVAWLAVPLTTGDGRPSQMGRMADQIKTFGFFLLVRARRYFQVSADSLLAADKRSPVLFLQSFADDEKQQFRSSQRALLDFSLETRLANHFERFGPFIAVGSPTSGSRAFSAGCGMPE